MTTTAHHHVAHHAQRAASTAWQRVVVRIAALPDTLYTWQARYANRQRLLAMDDRMLSDMGIGRCEAWREGRKPFWRA